MDDNTPLFDANDFDRVTQSVRNCTLCADHLPLGPRPVIHMEKQAKILIIGQAPGTKVHETGNPWNDASGNRLREWLGTSKETFYDATQFAIMPMGFCYPGRIKNGGDAPPRPECAPKWHDILRAQLPHIELTLLIGMYAQKHYLPDTKSWTLTKRVAHWQDFAERGFLPMPHPSWRSTHWLKKNPWFEAEILPLLRIKISSIAG